MSRTSTGYLFACLLAMLVVGCGGGPGDAEFPQEQEPAVASRALEIVARTGPIVAVRVGQTATLSDLNSYTSSEEPLSFQWSFSSKPDASNAVLQYANTPNPSFVADAWGDYRVQLVVNAEGKYSERAVQLVVATISPEPPTGPANHEGLSSICVVCHSDELDASPKPGKIPGKSPDHVASSSMCETCHTPLAFDMVPFVDHQEVFGNCSQCHNGVVAVGKSNFHVPTTLECDDCHNTTSFFELGADGNFDHTGITSGCAGCHNGISAIGMTDTAIHQNSTGECELCHNTTDFADARPDHTAPVVTDFSCDSCHNGTDATGQSNGHPDMSVDCGICHNTQTFSLGGLFDHGVIDSVNQPCADCHNVVNSINAILKTPTPPHPLTTEDCGTCHNVQDFSPAFIDHTTPAVTDFRCDSCHDGAIAKGVSFNHMPPTPDDCNVCHTPGTFASGVYDHAGEVSNCISCHDNVNDPDLSGTGKPSNHLPTAQDCVICHTTIEFIPTIFNHVGITDNCASCHDGNYDRTGAMGLSLNHLPINDPQTNNDWDCSVCHTTDSFMGATFIHGSINDNCASCHATGNATPKKVNHIPALEECSECHIDTNPGGFASTIFLANVHQNFTQGCEGCHTSQFLAPNLVKAANHLPTNQDCYLCHTTDMFAPSIFDHVGISGNCVSCHDGNYVGLNAREAPPTTIHQNTTADCVVCHNTVDFAAAFVDHNGPDVTGRSCESCHNGAPIIGPPNDPIHQNTTEDCGVCHVAGGTFTPAVFDHTGIVDNCASCHDGTAATGSPNDTIHQNATGDCSVCHNTKAFAGARFDHQGIVNNCASCHDGATATGKHNDHVPTNGDCVDCHQTTGFKPATFDHVGIVDNCASCHDGQLATGKTPTPPHPDTNQDCGVCHNPEGFVPATFDHTGIVDNCASCHDGNPITGLSPNHIPTALDCHFCHTTATFADGSWDHQGVQGNCVSCHNGVIATGSSPQGPNDHFVTVQDCNACHTTQSWAANDYKHLQNGDYPGDHRGNVGCVSCHKNNNENISYRFNYPGTCAGCHANDYKEGPHKKSENPDTKYTVSELRDCAGACHVYTNGNFNVIKKTRNNKHNTDDGDF